jgi:hypothetical protein
MLDYPNYTSPVSCLLVLHVGGWQYTWVAACRRAILPHDSLLPKFDSSKQITQHLDAIWLFYID